MSLNLYDYYTGPHLVGDNYQADIPAIAYHQLKKAVPSYLKKNRTEEQDLMIKRYRRTITKDPDLAAEFATSYLVDGLWGIEEEFAAKHAKNIQNLVNYMEKFGRNQAMAVRLERDGTIKHRISAAVRLYGTPLGSQYDKEILTLDPIELVAYIKKFAKLLPVALVEKIRKHILTDVVATALYIGLTQQRWSEGERVLLNDYKKNPSREHLIFYAFRQLGHINNISDLDQEVHEINRELGIL